MNKARINIVVKKNNNGLRRDANILVQILRNAGFKVSLFTIGNSTISHKIEKGIAYLKNSTNKLFKKAPVYDINLFLEEIFPSWLSYARINCLIPNQEWFRESSLPYLSQMDYVLCKTKYGQNIFEQLGCKSEFISFTSLDRFGENYPKNYDVFFHLGSGSYQKGSREITKLWRVHPEWPRLILRQIPQPYHVPAPNIEYITDFLDDQLLRQYQNTYGLHLCPSKSEGFGHYIVEAMSTKAVTLTTNAPPMNELITPDRGLLAEYNKTEPERLGTNYYVDSQSLEQKIEQIIGMDITTKKQLGEKAREWYLDNDRFFREKIVEVLSNV